MIDDDFTADFYAFNADGSNKWKYHGRGHLTPQVFSLFGVEERRAQILQDNDGKFPGMSTDASEFVWVVIADANVEYGWPLMLAPGGGDGAA